MKVNYKVRMYLWVEHINFA